MKKSMLHLFAIAIISTFLASCRDSESTLPVSTAAVAVKTTLYFPTVTSTYQSSLSAIPPGGVTCDQVTLSSVRILVSSLKLLHDNNDTLGSGEMHEGPFVAYFLPGQTVTASVASIVPGLYDRVKFETHQYNPSIDNLSDSAESMADFASDRSTIIIEGTVYANGVTYPFTYRSHMIANLQDRWDEPLSVEIERLGYTILVDFYPPSVFMTSDGQVLDPRDPANAQAIDAAIKTAFI